jgi:branched-chain amino acid transport system permease protein
MATENAAETAETRPAPGPQGLHKRTIGEWIQPIAFVLIGVLLPYIQPVIGDRWLPTTTMTFCVIYALFAAGLNVVVGYAGLLDLGYVAFFLFGSYTAAWLMSNFFAQVDPGFNVLGSAIPTLPGIHITFWFVVIIAGVFCAIWGVIIGAPTLRLKSDYLALVTLGFGEILPQVARQADSIKGFNLTNGTSGIGPLDPVDTWWINQLTFGAVPEKLGPFDDRPFYYITFGLCALFVLISLRLREGKLGRAWLAVREDELAASLMGVPLMRTKLWAYAVGAFAGGFAGPLYAARVGVVNVDTFTFLFSVIVLCMVIVGGMGNVYGVMLAGFVIEWINDTGLREIGASINSTFGTSFEVPNYEFMFFGLVLVLMMLFRPDGFLPAARQKRVRQLEAQIEKVGTEPTTPAEARA